MTYPLVLDLTADGIPVAVTCRVLGFTPPAFYAWRANPVSQRAGPPVHDDHVKKVFTAEAANRLWLTDITEHPTAEGKLYLCAIKDVHSGRIVGYSIDTRHASGPGCRGVAQRRPVAGPGRDGGALGSG